MFQLTSGRAAARRGRALMILRPRVVSQGGSSLPRWIWPPPSTVVKSAWMFAQAGDLLRRIASAHLQRCWARSSLETRKLHEPGRSRKLWVGISDLS